MTDDSIELLVYEGLKRIKRISVNEINGMNVWNGVLGECCIDVDTGAWNIKEVICSWMEMRFLAKVIGELGKNESVGLGILGPGGLGEEAILLLHTGLGERDIFEGRGRQKRTILICRVSDFSRDLVCVSGA